MTLTQFQSDRFTQIRLLSEMAKVACYVLRMASLIHPLKHPLRMLVIIALLSLPKLWFVITAQPKTFSPSPKMRYPLQYLSWFGIPNWHYGDEWLLYSNLRRVSQISDVAKWFYSDWVGQNGFYRPLSSLSLLVDHMLWNNRRCGYLLTSWLLQVFSAWLIAILFASISRDAHSAVFGAASFALIWYPPTAVTMSFMSTRPDVLCAPFLMLSLLLTFKWCRGGGYLWLSLACLSALLSLLAKESAWMLPILSLACLLLVMNGMENRSVAKIAIAIACFVLIISMWLVLYAHILPETFSRYGLLALKRERFFSQAYLVFVRLLPQVSDLGSWLIGFPYSIPTGITLRLMVTLPLFVALLILSWHYARIALLLSFVWIAITPLPLISVRLWSPHYFYVPSFGTHMLNGALLAGALQFALTKMGYSRLAESQFNGVENKCRR